MQQNYSFQPIGATGTTPTGSAALAVTTSVQQLNLPSVPADGATMRIVVDGTSQIAWSYGVSSGLTMANGIRMLANEIESFSVPPGITQLSVIGTTTGSTISVSIGSGQ